MAAVFLTCAVFGGTLLVAQFLLNLLGLGLGGGDGDVSAGHVDAGADWSGDAGGDFSPGHSADVDASVGQDGGGFASSDHPGDFASLDGHHHPAVAHHHGHETSDVAPVQQGAWRIARFLTLQTIVAFLAFFGLGGLWSLDRGQGEALATATGFAFGIASAGALGWVMRKMRYLESDGGLRMNRAVGCRGRVYLRIPGENAGVGKVTITIQGRTIEMKARTAGPQLPTGASVIVRSLLDAETVDVAAASEPLEAKRKVS